MPTSPLHPTAARLRRDRRLAPVAAAAVLSAAAVALTPGRGGAQGDAPRATVTPLPRASDGTTVAVLPGLGRSGALNASGQVAGWTWNGVTYSGVVTGPDASGPAQLLPKPAGVPRTYMSAVSDDGRVVGEATRLDGSRSHVVYFDGRETRLASAVPTGWLAEVTGVNDAGRIVGWFSTVDGSTFRTQGWVSGPDGGALTLLPRGGSGGDPTGVPLAINNAGRIVGGVTTAVGVHVAAYWDPAGDGSYDAPTRIAGLGAAPSSAIGVSSTGAVTGRFNVGNETRAFYWSGAAGEAMRELPMAGSANPFPYMEGRAVNRVGQVVGRFFEWTGTASFPRAFVWDAAGGARALDEFVDGWQFDEAYAINDRGQVLASGYRTGSSTYEYALVTLATVPEPETWLLLGVGLAVASIATRRRRAMQ